ncbi:MAG: hypothetical protein IJ597_02835 [Synergistaceae bacterium]|nr:hypothetical protein [Synergistaceae bacterium]
MGMIFAFLEEAKQKIVEQVIWAEKNLSGKTGNEKKAAVVKKLDELIKLPPYLEWVDDMVISYLVDQACDKLNALTAHNFGNVELNDVDKARVADEMKVQSN